VLDASEIKSTDIFKLFITLLFFSCFPGQKKKEGEHEANYIIHSIPCSEIRNLFLSRCRKRMFE